MGMKQYSKLFSFGCSFTDIGGLNSPMYHYFLSDDGILTTFK